MLQGVDSLDENGRKLPPSIWVELDQTPLFLEDEPPAARKGAPRTDEDEDDNDMSFGFGMPRRDSTSPGDDEALRKAEHEQDRGVQHRMAPRDVQNAQHPRTVLASRGARRHEELGRNEREGGCEDDLFCLEHLVKFAEQVAPAKTESDLRFVENSFTFSQKSAGMRGRYRAVATEGAGMPDDYREGATARETEDTAAERKEVEMCVQMLQDYANWALRIARKAHRKRRKASTLQAWRIVARRRCV